MGTAKIPSSAFSLSQEDYFMILAFQMLAEAENCASWRKVNNKSNTDNNDMKCNVN